MLEAEAREHEVQAVLGQAADRLAVAWVVPELVAGAAAVEVAAEQGNNPDCFWLGPVRSNFRRNFCQLQHVSE